MRRRDHIGFVTSEARNDTTTKVAYHFLSKDQYGSEMELEIA